VSAFRLILARFAALLLVLQAGWSGAAAMAVTAGYDEARILCATLHASPAAQEHAEELAVLFGFEDTPPFSPDDALLDCAACFALTLSAPCAGAAASGPPPLRSAPRLAARIDIASPRQTAGPPVGLRAPPVLI